MPFFGLLTSYLFYFQTDFARSKFVEALQGYQQVERDYRQRYKQRVERQFKIGELPRSVP